MVKSPRIRHAKSGTEPVTIDLPPGEVSRVKAEAEASAASEATREPAAASEPDDTGQSSTKPTDPAVTVAAANGETSSPGSDPLATSAPGGEAGPTGKDDRTAGSTKAAASTSPGGRSGEASPSAGKEAGTTGAGASAGASARTGTSRPAPSAFGRGEPPRAEPKPRAGGGGSGALLAGLVGGLVVIAVAGGLQYAGFWPQTGAPDRAAEIFALENEVTDLRQAVAELRDAAAAPGEPAGDTLAEAIEARFGGVNEELDGLRNAIEALRDELGNVEAGGAPVDLAAIEDRIAALEQAVSGLDQGPDGAELQALADRLAALEGETGAGAALEAIAGRLATLEGETSAGVERQSALDGRLDAIEATLTDLSQRVEAEAGSAATALVIAASALKAAIDRGGSFAAELDTLAALAPGLPAIDALRAMAADGVPPRPRLVAEVGTAAAAMVAAGRPIDPEAGLFERLWASAEGMISVRPIGMVEGEDVPAIVARLEAAVAADDYDRALAEYETLPETAQAAGAGFITGLRARKAVDELIASLLATALQG